MAGRLFFGPFELRTDSGELYRAGVTVPLQPQPARLLELLARRAGEVVSREEIQRHLWGEETFVEFEQGLNFSIRRIRVALEDSASSPRYVETVPRRGYRFVAPVEVAAPAGEPAPAATAPESSLPARPAASQSASRMAWGGVLLVALLALLAWAVDRRLAGPPVSPHRSGALTPQAFRAYTEGRYLARNGKTPEQRRQAVSSLQEAALLAPDYAPAHLELALVRLDFSRPPGEVVPAVEAAARRALALDPGSGGAWAVLANLDLYFRFDWSRARRGIERALASSPGEPEPHRLRAAYLAARGGPREAVREAQRAQLLDPSSSLAAADLAWYCFLARRYGDSLDWGRRSLTLQPDDLWTRRLLVDVALAAGEPEVALAQANASLAFLWQRNLAQDLPARVESLEEYWRLQVERMTALTAAGRPVSPFALAIPVLHLGDRERALRLLADAGRRKFGWELAFLAVDPRFDPLRTDPRFREILRGLGLDGVPGAVRAGATAGRGAPRRSHLRSERLSTSAAAGSR